MIVGYLNDIPFVASRFIVRTFSGFSRDGEGRWEEHALIGQKPVLEFVGPGTESISFSMMLRGDQGIDPITEIEKLAALRDSGTPFPLVIGDKPVGEHFWVLKSLSHEVTFWDKQGNAVSINASVTLSEYVMSEEDFGEET